MSVDELIDPPYFPALDKKYKALKGSAIVQVVYGVILLVGAAGTALLAVNGGEELFPMVGIFTLLGVLFILMSRLSKKRFAKVEAELEKAVQDYITLERNKLSAIKAKMNDAEWENYKLQLQNQKLLVELNRKQNVKTRTTTTTTSWVAEVGD
jgi:hypothetical protein